MISLHGLTCFVAAVDGGSVTAASAALRLSQPAVSHQIAQLEREIGVRLLHRGRKGVRVTTAGAALMPAARQALDAASLAVSVARDVAAGRGGTLRVGVVESLVTPILAPVMQRFTEKRSGIRVVVVETIDVRTLDAALRAGRIDLAVGPGEGDAPASTTFSREQAVVVLSHGHRLAADDAVSWPELAAEGIVHYEIGNSLGAWIDGAAAAASTTLTALHRTRSAATAASLAAAGLGPAIVPTSAVRPEHLTRPLSPPLERDLVVRIAGRGDPLAHRFRQDLLAMHADRSAGERGSRPDAGGPGPDRTSRAADAPDAGGE